MKAVERLVNRSEQAAYAELQNIAESNNLKVFPKVRLSDVLAKGPHHLTKREFDFYTRSHCDFVLTDEAFRPVMVVEYDGPMHADAKQKERDAIKNAFFEEAELGLLRINDKHVTRHYRGMTVLRWIIEVTELQKGFDQAQQAGQIPMEEDFDPAFLMVGGKGRFPYWLSAEANIAINKFRVSLPKDRVFGWHSFIGYDTDGTATRLSTLRVDDRVLWSKTAVRRQGLDFPHFELLNEVDGCELGTKLALFQAGSLQPSSPKEFGKILQRFCNERKVHPSFSTGNLAVNAKYDFKNGWDFTSNPS
ncbi:DUF2726 domain-containing protein [Telmatospirillum sp.]|uniref:DUF2726 domain-containing protein n=1 Tax=Telmatospirillum sp. TaxID=2079197 RepID=UPI00284B60D7|nr:DUF2726 domain-containing protein [Telmatospirillum sp.]MDR3439976.1 DUF2726 domain-containing protein [Telmatospirillum sp.]